MEPQKLRGPESERSVFVLVILNDLSNGVELL